MTYQEFFSTYSYDRNSDLLTSSPLGKIYRAQGPDGEVWLRICTSTPGQDGRLTAEASEATKYGSPYIPTYEQVYVFEESTSAVECAVMEAFPLGNLPTLLSDWKLSPQEKSQLSALLDELARTVAPKGTPDPENVYISQSGEKLIPHLIDVSLLSHKPAERWKETLALLDASEPDSEPIPCEPEDTSSTPGTPWWKSTRAILCGVAATWIAVITLIAALHVKKNTPTPDTDGNDTTSVPTAPIYPADRYAMEEAMKADSLEKARADSLEKVHADSIAAQRRKAVAAERKEKEVTEQTADETSAAPDEAQTPLPHEPSPTAPTELPEE